VATITIDDDVMKDLAERAAKESRSADDVANELLRKSVKPYKLELEGWPAELKPGVDLTDRNKLYELMDGAELVKKYGR
jgi:plasmid stability protein